ncbi:type III effector phosphothreonine lyase [Trinickia caryophylli]|nr:type III effector phosphothreonine lyase [Trinickia caryophylli]WQE11712.1 type III effector phosphothreonine lyase [Trinickia caryophylli]
MTPGTAHHADVSPSTTSGAVSLPQGGSQIRSSLITEFDALARELGQMSQSELKPSRDPITYGAMNSGGYMKLHAGFALFKRPSDVFINALRRQSSPSSGDKLHVSVDESRVEDAFDTIAGLLFSDDSPIDQWKIVDTRRVAKLKDTRVSHGANITLYVEPSNGTAYSSRDLSRVRALIDQIEAMLSQAGIAPGIPPASDAVAPQWRYVSYRNEHMSSREDGGPMQRSRLAGEPFFRLVSGHVR